MSVKMACELGDATLVPTESDALFVDGINFTKPSNEFMSKTFFEKIFRLKKNFFGKNYHKFSKQSLQTHDFAYA